MESGSNNIRESQSYANQLSRTAQLLHDICNKKTKFKISVDCSSQPEGWDTNSRNPEPNPASLRRTYREIQQEILRPHTQPFKHFIMIASSILEFDNILQIQILDRLATHSFVQYFLILCTLRMVAEGDRNMQAWSINNVRKATEPGRRGK